MVEIKQGNQKKEYPSKGLWDVLSNPFNFDHRKWLF